MMIKHFIAIKWALFALDTLCYWTSVITIGRQRLFSFTIPGLFAYSLIYIVLILSLYSFKTYGQEVLSNGKKDCLLRILIAIMISAIFSTGVITLFFSAYNLDPVRFLKSLSACFLFMPFTRFTAQLYVRKMIPCRRCIVIGEKDKWHPLMKEISCALSRKLLPVAYCPPDLGDLALCIAKRKSSDMVIITEEKFVRNNLVMDRIRKEGLQIYYLPHVAEKALKKIPMSVLESFKSYYTLSFQGINSRNTERSFNLALAGTLAILSLPFTIIAALAICIKDGRPILFRQTRTGKDNKPFIIYKFRTMAQAPSCCHGDPEKDGRRLTKTGKFIRKLRLDEIPQFINVIRGDMNLVGPRPEIDKFIGMCSGTIPFYEYRHKIKPGITGWAQINYKYTSDIDTYKEKTEYDLYYVKNQNILLDITIILSTIGTMIGMKGAK